MNCTEIRKLSSAYADRELDLIRSTEVEHHLKSCQGCSQEVQNIRTLSSALKSPELYFRAPVKLRSAINSSISGNERAPKPKRSNVREGSWFNWFRWVIPIAATAIVIFAAVFFVPSMDNRLEKEIVAGHVRSLLAGHLTDVASTDQHTVKPWFNGKVDFAPLVVNLADRGYPLVGGRLDYLQTHTVAALVYQRNKHFINLFTWPSAKSRSTEKTLEFTKGYNLIHWEASGMNYWAVSDLNAGELREFADQIK